MSTISAMSRNSYLTAKISQQNSKFADIVNDSKRTQDWFNQQTNNKSRSKAYSSTSLDDLQKIASKQIASKQELMTKLEDYTKKAETFNTDFTKNATALKESATELSATDFSSGNTSDIISSVKSFASDYNTNQDYLLKNSDMSYKVNGLAVAFGSTKHSSRTLGTVGINVDSNGKLSVDEKKLSAALADNPDKVSRVLGKKGLANNTANKAAAALDQADSLIPAPSFANKIGKSQGLLLDLFI